jgi:low affinity Fe/Cu permease
MKNQAEEKRAVLVVKRRINFDELIRSIKGARNSMVNLEDLSDDELEVLQKQFKRIGQHYAKISGQVDEEADEIEDKQASKQKG